MNTPPRFLAVVAALALLAPLAWLALRPTAPAPTVAPAAPLGPAPRAATAPGPHAPLLPESSPVSPPPATAPRASRSRAPSATLELIPTDCALRNEIAQLTPIARERALAVLVRKPIPAEDFASLHADPSGGIFYVCALPPPPPGKPAPPVGAALALPAPPAGAAPVPTALRPDSDGTAVPAPLTGSVPIASPPIRHSRPGSAKTLFIDFNGAIVSGTAWNTSASSTFDCLPFDTDNDPTTFSTTEQAAIIEIWQRVAEDYAPFDIDVTTEQPASLGYYAAHALVTPSKDRTNAALPHSATAAGIAYLDEYGYPTYFYFSPAFIYSDKLAYNAGSIAEGVSHEIGHNMGLSHDGLKGGAEYYSGHGSGETSWAPIMGNSYSANVTQWSKGDYYNPSNTENDLSILDAKLSRRTDDTAATINSARALTTTGHWLAGAGIIETEGDRDLLSFTTLAGQVSVTASPYRSTRGTYGGDTDLKLELLGPGGNVIATAAPTTTTTATITTNVAAGTYYARVSAEGVGSPTNTAPTGYTAYGSIGQYNLTGTRVVATPTVTGPTQLDTRTGDTVDFRIVASDVAEAFQAYNLPSWLSLDASSGRITGVPTVAGTFYITLAASNNAGSAQCQLRLQVAAGGPVLAGLARRTIVAPGESVTLGVAATSSAPPVSYRWYRGGVALPAATQSTLVLSSITRAQAGWYHVVATDGNGSRASAPAFVLVAPTETDAGLRRRPVR
ncbi:MAG: immunoglobulin domain-containing protein [Opitutaceae bacterium]|nr:immunoglobulin domain-containing protein [Opitutaceae bacterium]